MKTLLLTPLLAELAPLLDAFHDMGYEPVQESVGKLPVYEIKKLRLLLAQGGHGKTQFGIQTQHLLDLIPNISLVICAGAAGGIAHSLKVGDLVIAISTIEHDYTTKFSAHPLPSFDGSIHHLEQLRMFNASSDNFNIHFGKVASGDEDIVEPIRSLALHDLTGAIAVAWEGAGGARAAKFMKIPYLEIRGLTDLADSDAPGIFYENLKIIMPRIAALVAKLQTRI